MRWEGVKKQREKGNTKTNPFLNKVNPNVTNRERDEAALPRTVRGIKGKCMNGKCVRLKRMQKIFQRSVVAVRGMLQSWTPDATGYRQGLTIADSETGLHWKLG